MGVNLHSKGCKFPVEKNYTLGCKFAPERCKFTPKGYKFTLILGVNIQSWAFTPQGVFLHPVISQ